MFLYITETIKEKILAMYLSRFKYGAYLFRLNSGNCTFFSTVEYKDCKISNKNYFISNIEKKLIINFEINDSNSNKINNCDEKHYYNYTTIVVLVSNKRNSKIITNI